MKVFVVSYDLRNAEREQYQNLYDALNEMGGREVLESTWTLKLKDEWTCEKVAKELLQFMDKDDGIFVTQITAYAKKCCDNEPHKFYD